MKKALFPFITLVLSLAIFILVGELALRITGHRPTVPMVGPAESFLEPDPILGWRTRPGAYAMPAGNASNGTRSITNWEDGSRATRNEFHLTQTTPKRNVSFIGCSITEGWALDDSATFEWKFQTGHPELDVRNYGTGGYGSYQSLLRLHHAFAGAVVKPEWVIYGLADFHGYRDAAPTAWVAFLSNSSNHRNVSIPYVRQTGAQGFSEHPPRGYRAWALSGQLALSAFLEDKWLRLKAKRESAGSQAILLREIQLMHETCKQWGTKFLVAELYYQNPENKSNFPSHFDQAGIQHVDCTLPLLPEWMIPGDGHPNGKATTQVATCLSDYLSPRLESLATLNAGQTDPVETHN